ncbi:unnamed protein product [Mytilus edulis]|uniref:Uncharacterized protein n=1 Tax=Mytilus edulis TaxID=6550 RepID=A0A8S3Q3K3_MYTED|nr:unnamed protein product [Mytilus edulis]
MRGPRKLGPPQTLRVHTTLVEGANDEKIVTVFPTPVVDGGMTDNTENSHSPPIEDPSSTGETDRKAATESNNPQKPPPVDSGASVFCVSTVRSGPNRRQWDPGIPYLNKGIKTVQVRKNETKLFTMENGSAQTSLVQLYSGHAATKWPGSSLYKDREELVYDPDKNNSQLSGLDFSPNGGGQNIGPPPQAQGRHGEMLDRGHIAPRGTPSQVQGQSAFRQEAWHQGQSPGPLEGHSQMDSAFLEYSSYPGDANARPEPTGNWDGGYREQLQKKIEHQLLVTQTSPHHMCTGVVLGTSRIGQVKTVRGTNLPRTIGAHLHTPWVTQATMQVRGQHPVPNQLTLVGDSMRWPAVSMARGKTIGVRTQGRPHLMTMGIGSKKQYNQGIQRAHTRSPQGSGLWTGYSTIYEDRPMENSRGPDNRGGLRGTLGGISKPNRREVRQVTDGQYGDHHEAFREYQGPHVRDTMALERAPVSTWKVELEKSDKKFENKLGQVHEKLDNMMDQFKQLLTSPIAGSCLPGRQTGTESCHHCGERAIQEMKWSKSVSPPNYRRIPLS